MAEKNVKRIVAILFSFVLLINFIFPSEFTLQEAKAAVKPSIATKMTISRGSLESDYIGYFKTDYYTLKVENPVKKATYSFTSSNKKIVTVKVSGSKATLTGVQAGTANITCQQKLNGKTTKVGTCKITVKNAVASEESYDGLPVGTNKVNLIYWSYRNCNATYTFTSDSADFTMKEVVEHLYNQPYKGKVVIDDKLKAAIDAYYEQYGVIE
jgi:hypothetical protein